MTDSRKVLVALPAYNEAKYIADLVRRSQEHADEVLVVDDGSTDDTTYCANTAGAIVLRHTVNKGYGSAIQSILAEARRRNPDVLVILDADTQHNPEEIPRLVSPVAEGSCDLAIGCRNSKDIPVFRRVGGRVLGTATRFLSGSKVVDTQCGFRAYSKAAVAWIRPQEKGMAVSSEIVSEATRYGLRIMEVPISVRYTADSSTHNPIAQGFYTLWRLLVIAAKRRTGR
jgi:glycosyltransferase involved in cell wall biosynthesis